LSFDSSIFSASCSARIAQHAFERYDEVSSLRLVSFFWTEPFLLRIYDVSKSDRRLDCGLDCLLLLDRRPLAGSALAEKLVSAIHEAPTVDYSFALARTMSNRKLAIEEIARFITSAGHVSDAVLENLFLLDDSENVLATFQLQPSQVCLVDRCIKTEKISDLHDCDALDHFWRSARGHLHRATALKLWLFTSGQELARSCVDQGLHEPIEKVCQTTIGTVFFCPCSIQQ
jgi:hypothetical protein